MGVLELLLNDHSSFLKNRRIQSLSLIRQSCLFSSHLLLKLFCSRSICDLGNAAISALGQVLAGLLIIKTLAGSMSRSMVFSSGLACQRAAHSFLSMHAHRQSGSRRTKQSWAALQTPLLSKRCIPCEEDYGSLRFMGICESMDRSKAESLIASEVNTILLLLTKETWKNHYSTPKLL